jgi:glycosyltransferase
VIDIVIGLRENFIEHAYIMLYSLLEKNKDFFCKIHILSDKLDVKYFVSLEKKFNCQIKLYIIDISDIEKLDSRHIDVSTFYRLKMDQYLPRDLKKVLYIDTDIIVNGSLKSLIELEFEKEIYAMAVECKISVKHLSKIGFKNKKYFNAGLIYFDYQKCLEKDIFKKSLNLLMIEDKYDFMDQDVLNIVLENHVKYISPKWNYSGFFAVSELLGEKLIEDEPVIIHFTGREKPWNYMNINKYSFLYKEEYEKIYNKKLDITDKTFSKIIKKHLILFLYKFFITKKIIQYLRNKYRQ